MREYGTQGTVYLKQHKRIPAVTSGRLTLKCPLSFLIGCPVPTSVKNTILSAPPETRRLLSWELGERVTHNIHGESSYKCDDTLADDKIYLRICVKDLSTMPLVCLDHQTSMRVP